MAYIGPPPTQKLATPTSQYFSGNGSATAFTLNRPVNVAEDLNVYVNNVAQEPGAGKSYTATGTTLTFDAAPDAGTNNVYVVYRGLAEPTTRLEHPSGQPIAATTGTFSGALTATTGTFSGAVSMGANNITFSDGNGIDFSASAGSGATSSILNDYEEGTFTLTEDQGSITGDTSRSGRYVKIGRMVMIDFAITGTAITIPSYVGFSGLPFTPSDPAAGYTSTEDIDLANGMESAVGTNGRLYLSSGGGSDVSRISGSMVYRTA